MTGVGDRPGARGAAHLAPGPGQVLPDGGRRPPGSLRPRSGPGRGQEAHAGEEMMRKFLILSVDSG